jgi:hypothetical protein
VVQRLTGTGSVRNNDSDVDNTTSSAGGDQCRLQHHPRGSRPSWRAARWSTALFGKLTIKPDGTYTYVAEREGLVWSARS